MKTSRAAMLVAAAALALAGCSDGGGSTSSPDHNAADVQFASEMVPHHEQALRMVAMTRGRDLSPAFEELTLAIRAAQAPEIDTMTAWLDDWGAPPDDGHLMHGGDGNGMMGNANGMMGDGSHLGLGMMTGRELHRLGHASSRGFEDMWLRMMIVHHHGAIAMSRDEIDRGEYPRAIALARHIEDSQRAEIRQMRAMLAR